MIFNNIVAIIVYVLITVVSMLIMEFKSEFMPMLLIVTILSYIGCGRYILKPVKYEFLSVVSVLFILIVIFFYCLIKYGGGIESFIPYGICNIYASLFLWLDVPIAIFVTTVIPSLLMYIGLKLK